MLCSMLAVEAAEWGEKSEGEMEDVLLLEWWSADSSGGMVMCEWAWWSASSEGGDEGENEKLKSSGGGCWLMMRGSDMVLVQGWGVLWDDERVWVSVALVEI